jgi:hypothetical protein
MESLKNFLHLDVILRQCLGGAAFYLVLIAQGIPLPNLASIFPNAAGWTLAAILITVFLTGTFLHAVQRGILQVPIDRIRERFVDERRSKIIFPEKSLELTKKRFGRLSRKRMCSELYSWGASVHSLYTVAIGIFAGMVFVFVLNFNLCDWADLPAYPSDIPLLFFVVLLIFLGFISDCRKYILEQNLPDRAYRHNEDIVPQS